MGFPRQGRYLVAMAQCSRAYRAPQPFGSVQKKYLHHASRQQVLSRRAQELPSCFRRLPADHLQLQPDPRAWIESGHETFFENAQHRSRPRSAIDCLRTA